MSSESALERALPNNLDAERSILGAILLDNHALNAAVESLKPDDFFIPQHRNIFTRMIALGEAQQAIDLVTLRKNCIAAASLTRPAGRRISRPLSTACPASPTSSITRAS